MNKISFFIIFITVLILSVFIVFNSNINDLNSNYWNIVSGFANIMVAVLATSISWKDFYESELNRRKEKFLSINKICSYNQYQLRQLLSKKSPKYKYKYLFFEENWLYFNKKPIIIDKINLLADQNKDIDEQKEKSIQKLFLSYNILPNKKISIADNLIINCNYNIFNAPCYSLNEIIVSETDVKLKIKESMYFDFINTCFPFGFELAKCYQDNKSELKIRNRYSIFDFSNRYVNIGIVTLVVLLNVSHNNEKQNYMLIHHRGENVSESKNLINAVPGSTFQQSCNCQYNNLQNRLDKEGISYTITREFLEEIFSVQEFSYQTSVYNIKNNALLQIINDNTYYLGGGINPINVYFEILTVSFLDFNQAEICNLFDGNDYESINSKIKSNYEGDIYIEKYDEDVLNYFISNTNSAPTLQAICDILKNNCYINQDILPNRYGVKIC